MQINISDRIKESQLRLHDLVVELNEYNLLVNSIRTLQMVSDAPERFKNTSPKNIEKLTEFIRDTCAKHEILLPEYIEWGSIELI